MKKILLLGDSIRKGYDKYVKIAFEGVAQVYFPEENSKFSSFLMRNLLVWKKQLELDDSVDLVHFNAGLWDDIIMLDGKHHTSIDVYNEYIGRICDTIKILYPKAKIIFATSTPVQEELFVSGYKRFNKDTEKYNEIAVETVKKHGGEINDLYSLVKKFPKEYYSDMTHLYTKEGTECITNQVIKAIESALDIKGNIPDYEVYFNREKNIEGI